MASLDDMIVYGQADALRLTPAVDPVLVIHNGAEDGHIGHLPADDTSFHERTSHEVRHFSSQAILYPGDKIRSLIVINFLLECRQKLPVLCIASGWICDLEEANQR